MSEENGEAKTLEQDEINALLGQIEEGEELDVPDQETSGQAAEGLPEDGASVEEEAPLAVKIFDFIRPEWLSQQDMESLLQGVEKWASLTSFELSRLLGCSVDFQMNSLDLLKADELYRSLPTQALGGLISWIQPPGQGGGDLLVLFPNGPFRAVRNALLGKKLFLEEKESSQEAPRGRLDKRLAGYLLDQKLLPSWERAWRRRGFPRPRLNQVENRLGRMELWCGDDSLITISMEMTVEGISGSMTVAFSWQTFMRLKAQSAEEGGLFHAAPQESPAAAMVGGGSVVDTELVFPLHGGGWNYETLKRLRRGEALFLPGDVKGRRMVRPQKGELYGD